MKLQDKLFIHGDWVAPLKAGTIDVINPATGEKVGTVPDASKQDLDAAVAAARASFEDKRWRGKDPSEKETILWRWADLLEQHKHEMAAIIKE